MKDIKNISVKPKTSIKETMKIIDQSGIKIAIVIEDSKLVGVITDGDIRRGILKGVDIEEAVSTIMNKNPAYVKEGTNTINMIQELKQKKILGMPIVDDNNVVKDFILLSEGTGLSSVKEESILRKHLSRILVIGGAGYIGSILVRKLLDKGYNVTVLDNFLYGKESMEEIKDNPKLRIIEGDTRHIEDVTKAIEDADAVVHLAELVGDPACALDPSTTQEINYMATRIVASICKHFQINRMVYASSCSVYGASKGDELLTEESSLNPVSLYAKMKIASERALAEMKDDNFMPTVLRLSTVFGFSPRPRFDLVVNLLTAKAVKEGKITVFGGDQWRPNVHVGDVADTILAVLEAPINTVGSEIFNVGSEENNYTINKIGELVKEAVPSAELVIEEKEVDKRDYKVDFTKLRKMLDINMKMSVSDGIFEIKDALNDIDYKDKRFSNIRFLENKNGKHSNA